MPVDVFKTKARGAPKYLATVWPVEHQVHLVDNYEEGEVVSGIYGLCFSDEIGGRVYEIPTDLCGQKGVNDLLWKKHHIGSLATYGHFEYPYTDAKGKDVSLSFVHDTDRFHES